MVKGRISAPDPGPASDWSRSDWLTGAITTAGHVEGWMVVGGGEFTDAYLSFACTIALKLCKLNFYPSLPCVALSVSVMLSWVIR